MEQAYLYTLIYPESLLISPAGNITSLLKMKLSFDLWKHSVDQLLKVSPSTVWKTGHEQRVAELSHQVGQRYFKLLKKQIPM